eukprot:m.746315 g.746315  ORF g.746315 m.746315 type:complete len:873 (-) comp23135_c1_seq3:203-2821(-)
MMAAPRMRNVFAALDAAREAVTCSLCQDIISDAVAVAHCRCQFCRECIKEVIDDSGSCPVHSTPVFPKDLQPDHQLNGVLRHLAEIGALLDEQRDSVSMDAGGSGRNGPGCTASQMSQGSGPSRPTDKEHGSIEAMQTHGNEHSDTSRNQQEQSHDNEDDSSGSDLEPSFVQKHVAKKRGKAKAAAGSSVDKNAGSAGGTVSNKASDYGGDCSSTHNTTASHADAVPPSTRTYGRRQGLRRGALRRRGRGLTTSSTVPRSTVTSEGTATTDPRAAAPALSPGGNAGAAATHAWVLEQQRLHRRSVARQQRANDQDRRRKQQQSRAIRAAASLSVPPDPESVAAAAANAPDTPGVGVGDVLDDLESPVPDTDSGASADPPDAVAAAAIVRSRHRQRETRTTVTRQRAATRAVDATADGSSFGTRVAPGGAREAASETTTPHMPAQSTRQRQPRGSARTPLAQRPAHTNNITPAAAGRQKRKSTRSTPGSSPGERSVHRRNHFGETPLHQAAKRGYRDTIEQLLARDAEVNATDHNGWTPLHEACHHKHPGAAAALLAGNADPNGCVGVPGGLQLTTPLHEAAENAHAELIDILLSAGATAAALDKDGRNAESLLPAGAPDALRTTLAAARERGHSTVVEPMRPLAASGTPPIVICTASVPKNLKGTVASALQVLGDRDVHITTEYCNKVTHVVTAVDTDNRCRRTQKYMLGVLHGNWIVSFDWLIDSANSDRMADERAYVADGDVKSDRLGGPLRSHDNFLDMGPRLFCGKFFCIQWVRAAEQKMKSSDLARLLTDGGGKLVKTERDLQTAAARLDCGCAFVVRSDARDGPPRTRCGTDARVLCRSVCGRVGGSVCRRMCRSLCVGFPVWPYV